MSSLDREPRYAADAPDSLVVRDLASRSDLDQCIELQHATWGRGFRELVPHAMLRIVHRVGGVLIGAFDRGSQLQGFVFGVTGWVDGRPVHWSHMMAVQANAQDRGIGRLLKSAQRSRLLDAGVEVAKWTFDPLVARNAYLNLVRLGASVVDYVPDMYGDDPMSTTDSVIGSDRLLVEWDLRSEPPAVPRRAASVLPAPLLTLFTDVSRPEGLPETPIVHVAIPSDIQEVKTADAELAKRWRSLTRHVFLHYASRGYEVRAFTRHTHDGGWYHLEQIERAGA